LDRLARVFLDLKVLGRLRLLQRRARICCWAIPRTAAS
jgi:hypothetical protein